YLCERDDVEIVDLGNQSQQAPQPYYAVAQKVAQAIQAGVADRGILACGTGQGMAIVANKHKGIYACVVDDIFSGKRAKIINNANVITFGAWITAPYHAKEIVAAWLSMSFCQEMEHRKDVITDLFNNVKKIEDTTFK
ncbi:MAG TPA: RpiB/LacA/LacB family sugar-phosphate isomerase, partial [Phycisphaerae bacterium]|nr:RpiB/LacA/LacB family sugar-phosphate isomerase [Phycisphaerae bacterium]